VKFHLVDFINHFYDSKCDIYIQSFIYSFIQSVSHFIGMKQVTITQYINSNKARKIAILTKSDLCNKK
jgi:hypothetical protein